MTNLIKTRVRNVRDSNITKHLCQLAMQIYTSTVCRELFVTFDGFIQRESIVSDKSRSFKDVRRIHFDKYRKKYRKRYPGLGHLLPWAISFFFKWEENKYFSPYAYCFIVEIELLNPKFVDKNSYFILFFL